MRTISRTKTPKKKKLSPSVTWLYVSEELLWSEARTIVLAKMMKVMKPLKSEWDTIL